MQRRTGKPLDTYTNQHADVGHLSISDVNTYALLDILIYLDPLSLYSFSLTSQAFRSIAISELLWKMHVVKHFSIQAESSVKSMPFGNRFFTQTTNEYYRGFSNEEKKCFTLIRANDLYSITERKIDFTIEILDKLDSKGHSLLSLIRKQNNRALNEYVFKQICNKESCSKYLLIRCAIKLDQAGEYFQQLLKAEEEESKTSLSMFAPGLLSKAVQYNSIRSAEVLLKLNAGPNGRPEPILLCMAAQKGMLEMVNLLLDYSADIDAGSSSALYLAAQNGHVEVVKCLVNRGANIDSCSQETGSFPLYTAMQNKQTAILVFLLERGANVKLKYNGFSPLYMGARDNHLDGVKALLAHCKENGINVGIDDIGGDSSTPLYVAAQNGHADMVRLLAESEANVECGFSGGYTPLYVASQNGDHAVVEVLCQFKPNYNHISPNGSVALYVAAQNGHTEVVRLLCKQPSCDVDITYKRYTPLYIACQKGHLSNVKVLLEHGANINHQAHRNATPLHVAVRNRHKEIVGALLEKGADFNLRLETGATPLHCVCHEVDDYNICMAIITLLIRAGADPLSLDLHGRTPAMLTSNTKVEKILLLLEELAAQDMRQLVSATTANPVADKDFIIKEVTSFISDKCKRNNSLKAQAELCLNLLMDTSTPFGLAVILYSLLDKEPTQTSNDIFNFPDAVQFIRCIIKALGFESKAVAKNSLYSMIFSSLASDEKLLDKLKKQIIQPIVFSLNRNAEFNVDSYNAAMLCLNLFEAKIKQSHKLASLEQEKKLIAFNQVK
ncbi:MAG: ankyrin repeat domain-containing protein [Gammaproteobacteria bacterium]|nr:ankyrin repeat domain-containing protein [Gammaproteobacteria bacterium]MCW5583322.1 ankyrin repeat domain-containing protein [Gammaproteobacteria bacterium]